MVCAVLAPAIMQQNVVVSLGLVKFHFKTKLHKNIKCAKTITKLTQINWTLMLRISGRGAVVAHTRTHIYNCVRYYYLLCFCSLCHFFVFFCLQFLFFVLFLFFFLVFCGANEKWFTLKCKSWAPKLFAQLKRTNSSGGKGDRSVRWRCVRGVTEVFEQSLSLSA